VSHAALLLALGLLGMPPAHAAPPSPETRARVRALEEMLDEEDYLAARAELERLRGSAPIGGESFDFFSGRVAFGEGRYAEAVEALEAAGVEDRPGSYLRLARDTLAITKNHARAESEHFVFLYPPGKDQVLVPYALETLEAQRAALLEDLGHAPAGKVRIEVVNDASELARVSTLSQREIDQTGTIAICKFNKLMITSPKAVLRGYDWLDTLAHEYTHFVVTQAGHNSVPIWLQEALAKYLESRWHGPPGRALPPSSRALLAERVAKNQLIPFAKMHPSMAKLPSWKDAATAFAEVFFAAEYLHKEHGMRALRTVVEAMGQGATDAQAVEKASGKPFAQFEKGWMAYLKSQPVPKGAPLATADKPVLRGKHDRPEPETKGREISFGEFDEVEDASARRWAHLGELFRERGRFVAAAEEYGKAHALVGSAYESVSNKYALALMAVRRLEDAEKVLRASLDAHPGNAATQVHLGRIYLTRGQWKQAREAYRGALAQDPFDPEIHLALLKSAESLGDGQLAGRARTASTVLTGVPTDQLPLLLARLPGPQSDPSDVALPRVKPDPVAPTPRPPPKKTKPSEPTSSERL
jgi:tetratricopeptide (TPR) repeat protein